MKHREGKGILVGVGSLSLMQGRGVECDIQTVLFMATECKQPSPKYHRYSLTAKRTLESKTGVSVSAHMP